MEKRTVERFKKQSILLHWVHAVSFVFMVITGGIMFFHLASFQGGQTVRVIHLTAAAFFVGLPVIYCLVYPKAAANFIKETFHWDINDLRWLKQSPRFYFGGEVNKQPPQDRINGGQKLWQMIAVLACLLLLITGIILWLFRLSISVRTYEVILLTHGIIFLVVLLGFLVHFYVASFHPYFDESLSSMIDGKVTSSYARKHYSRWYDKAVRKKADAKPE
jgi:formate dehydrogenase subunit gamma